MMLQMLYQLCYQLYLEKPNNEKEKEKRTTTTTIGRVCG